MRILFLSQLLPLPLDAGPKVRAYYVLRRLVEAGHEVTLLCFVRPTDREADVAELRRMCHAVETVPMRRSRVRDVRDLARSVVSKAPFLILRDHVPPMAEAASRVAGARAFDAVHADQLWMAPYAAGTPAVPLRVLDQHNAVFRVPERLAEHQRSAVIKALLRREAAKLASFERSAIDAFGRVVWVSEADRDACGAGANGRADAVIPIAVDPAAQPPIDRPWPFRVTFLGGIHWPPNAEGARWFAERVWPAVSRAVPGAVFTVIGKGAERLGGIAARSRIELAGYVPDLAGYLSETAAFVVPLLSGAGMRVKILDAWCWGVPVVSTTVGAESLRFGHGENLMIGDAPETFAEGVVRVLTDGHLARRLSANGRETVESFYDWREVYRAWDSVYQ